MGLKQFFTRSTERPVNLERRKFNEFIFNSFTLAAGLKAAGALGIGGTILSACTQNDGIVGPGKDLPKLNTQPVRMNPTDPATKTVTFGDVTFVCFDIIKGAAGQQPDFVDLRINPGDIFDRSRGSPSLDKPGENNCTFTTIDGKRAYRAELVALDLTDDANRLATFNFYGGTI